MFRKKLLLEIGFILINFLAPPYAFGKDTSNQEIIPVAIIGSGCAGLGAAMVTSEYGYSTWIFSGPRKGGDLNARTEVGNWLGVPTTYGNKIMKIAIDQATSFGAKILDTEITSVDFSSQPFKLRDAQGNLYLAHKIIIATGTKERLLNVPGAQENREKIFYNWDIHKDFKAFQSKVKGKKVGIIGGGIDAMKKAIYAARGGASEVQIFVRSNKLKIPSWRENFLHKMSTININYNVEIERIESSGNSIKLITNSNSYDLDVLVSSIGRVPQSTIFKNFLKIDDKGFIIVNVNTFETSVPGVYACGDVTDFSGPQPQALIAVGNGLKVGYFVLEELLTMNLPIQEGV